MAQSKYWMFTQNFKDREVVQPEFDPEVVQFAVWQHEKGDQEGTDHLQGYVELKKRCRITGARKLLPRPASLSPEEGWHEGHWEVRKGNQEQAIEYCTKEDTREDGPWRFGEQTERDPDGAQGQRSDLIILRDAVRNKRSAYDMLNDDEVAVTLLKHPRAFALAQQAFQSQQNRNFRTLETTVLWGPTGTGKTRKAMAWGSDEQQVFKWNPCNPEWWDGYNGEEILVIDEFYGQLKPSRMLQLLDGYVCRLPIKGGFHYAAWKTVIITSNKNPDEWYGGGFMAQPLDDRVKAALSRRLHTITYMD